MPESNELLSAGAQLIGMPLAGPESFSQQQLDYLKRALGVDETVLWENTNGVSGSSFPLTLSESPANFERVRYEFRPWTSNKTIQEKAGNETSIQLDAAWANTASSLAYSFVLILSVSGTSLSFVRNIFYQWGTSSINTSDTSQFRLFKVVGVHRIAGGN